MTRLIYLEQMQTTECEAAVTRLETSDGATALFLDATIFYPQGGGQPFDQGVIESEASRFVVEQVRWRDEEVAHIGRFEGVEFSVGDRVRCVVDRARRTLHTRLHSAGHLVDMAVDRLGYGWKPGKGYHFPDGPYVEYAGELGVDKEVARAAIETNANELVAAGAATRIALMTRDELASIVRFVPDYVPADRPSRVVFYGSFGVPCGGTHVAHLSDVGRITVRKLKAGGGTIRVSYGLAD